MNFNTDGFNERTNYIKNANDLNRIKKINSKRIDNSFVKMKMNENKPSVSTTNNNRTILKEEAKGKRENFVLRNTNINNVNRKNKDLNNILNRKGF